MATPNPRQLGPYEILSSLGKGGMGEVWRARDPRLNREIAIKISAQQFTDRFEREAHAIAALNHTNICTLFDIGPNYLVMEMVEGPTLAERIAEGPVPVEEALAMAKQIADALEAAHEKGVIHRDLKPANIKIRPDGSVKVLDFGLAKSGGDTAELTSDSPTKLTVAGMILGTAGYMAPEQARGKTVDKRADIWAFGVVVYEMVTAERLFDGETVTDTLAAVLTHDPDWTRVPAKMQKLLRRCLEKDPKKRLRDISGVEFLLAADDPIKAAPKPRFRTGLGLAGWVAAAAFAIIAAAVSFTHFREKAPETRLSRFIIVPPEGTHFRMSGGTPPAVSPDGRQVVFEAVGADGKIRLWLRALNSLLARPLAGTGGATFPFWSPDSKSIGFFAGDKMNKLDLAGGPAVALADVVTSNARGGTWSQDGVIVYSPDPYQGLRQVSASGGPSREVTGSVSRGAQRFPWFLPDGRHFLYLVGSGGLGTIHIRSLDSPASGDRVMSSGTVNSFAVYSQGFIIYLQGTTLLARPFDPDTLAFTGEVAPVAEQVRESGLNDAAAFSVSANGVLLYHGGIATTSLTWIDRAGKRPGTVGEPGEFGRPRFSPDRRTVAVEARENGNYDIWLYDLTRPGVRTRFTHDPAGDQSPVWSPDGRTIVFRSNRTGRYDLYRRPADGATPEVVLYADDWLKTPQSFSPDGKYLAYDTQGDPETGRDIWILPDPMRAVTEPMQEASRPYPFLRTEFEEQDPQFSPDGHWIAYQSNESGRYEVYVAPFPASGAKRQISTAGGGSPRWRPDGRELFYVASGNRMMAAETDIKSGAVAVNKIEPLFGPFTNGGYDVSVDGQRFLVITPPRRCR